MNTFTIQQNIFIDHHPLISLTICHEGVLNEELVDFLEITCGHIGLAPVYDAKCRLLKLAMATATRVFLITLSPPTATSSKKTKKTFVRTSLQRIFSNPDVTTYAFKMDYVAAALYLDYGMHLAAGKRLLSGSRKQLDGILAALGEDRVALNRTNIINLFRNEESFSNEPKTTALQAWAAYQAATMPKTCGRVLKLPVINTLSIDAAVCINTT